MYSNLGGVIVHTILGYYLVYELKLAVLGVAISSSV